jgi:hypothetical protein
LASPLTPASASTPFLLTEILASASPLASPLTFATSFPFILAFAPALTSFPA